MADLNIVFYKPLLIWSAIQEEVVRQRFVLKREMIGLDYEEEFFSIPRSGKSGLTLSVHFPDSYFHGKKKKS